MGKTKQTPDPKNRREAIDYIMRGIEWFIVNKPVKTIPVILVACGSWLVFGVNYYQNYGTEKMKMKSAEPITMQAKPIGALLSLSDIAYAQDKPINPIMIGKDVYGYFDPDYKIWKLKDQAAILCWNSKTRAVFQVDIPALADEVKMKSYVK